MLNKQQALYIHGDKHFNQTILGHRIKIPKNGLSQMSGYYVTVYIPPEMPLLFVCMITTTSGLWPLN